MGMSDFLTAETNSGGLCIVVVATIGTLLDGGEDSPEVSPEFAATTALLLSCDYREFT